MINQSVIFAIANQFARLIWPFAEIRDTLIQI